MPSTSARRTRATPPAGVVVLVGLGGALGASLRWAVDTATSTSGFPWPTLAVNVTGSFVLALLPAFDVVRRSRLLPPALGSGVLGGFTTLSAVSEQTRSLLVDGRVALGATYSTLTLAGCLLAVALADRLSTAAQRAEFDEEEGDL